MGGKRVTVSNYREDRLYPRIVRAVAALLERGNVVAPVDVVVEMGLLRSEHLLNWRKGQVPYLERVVQGSLSRLSRLLRILRFHAHDLRLAPSHTEYHRWGKGPKRKLRFTKTGDRGVEEAWSRHFVRGGGKGTPPPGRGKPRKPGKRGKPGKGS